MATSYISWIKGHRKAILDVGSFLRCYYLKATTLAGRYYLFSCGSKYHFIDNLKENLKDKNLFFKIRVLTAVHFSLQRRLPRGTRILEKDLSETEKNNIVSLIHHCESEGPNEGKVVLDATMMNKYFGSQGDGPPC